MTDDIKLMEIAKDLTETTMSARDFKHHKNVKETFETTVDVFKNILKELRSEVKTR